MRTRVKICGITNLKDAAAAVESGADALGFVFYAKSPRHIEPAKAAVIIKTLPPFVTSVGVFLDETLEGLQNAVSQSGVTCVQLHGGETPEFCDHVGALVIKAFRIKGFDDLEAIGKYRTGAYLLDTFKAGVPGGTGQTFDWEIALEAKKLGRIILSGGLNPGNVLDAVRHVNPYAVDVSSGVEKSPGIKDPGLIRQFIEELKKA